MPKLLNMARMGTSTTGTGSTILLDSTVQGFKSFGDAGAVTGDVLYLAIEDGDAREVGKYTYSSVPPSLTTRTVVSSTNAGSPIVLSGSAQIFSCALAESIAYPNGIVPGSVTVANLPAAATAGQGCRGFVTDATVTTFASVVAGGGANKVPVVSDGTNWIIG